MMRPVMTSLTQVHKSGMIHRDISPDNIMISKEGYVKLLDFGAAREFAESGNKSLSILLKPGYAPEEQYRSRGQQGPWTDIYALCATMYKAITGVTPDESSERMRMDEVKVPSALGVVLPPAQQMALMKGMAVLQENRWKSIDELVAVLYGGQTTAGFVPPAPMPPQRPYSQPNPAPQPASNQQPIPPEHVSKLRSAPGNKLIIVAILLGASGIVTIPFWEFLTSGALFCVCFLCSIVGLILGSKGKKKNIEAGFLLSADNKAGIIVPIIGLICNLFLMLLGYFS
jgi:serine/threonine protein kinase